MRELFTEKIKEYLYRNYELFNNANEQIWCQLFYVVCFYCSSLELENQIFEGIYQFACLKKMKYVFGKSLLELIKDRTLRISKLAFFKIVLDCIHVSPKVILKECN